MTSKAQIRNRAPAPIQITAEQILREAQERGLEDVAKAPQQFITDHEELLLYQQTKRKDFEDQIRRSRPNMGLWCRYGTWEASQMDFTRARSVWERALDVDFRSPTIWLKYAEMEMKHKFINHARNIWDRAVTLLPRMDTFWYKYSYMEEMVGAIDNARSIFERWMAWEPNDLAWAAYIKFEMRQGEVDKARALYERYVSLWPTSRAYLKYARWEESNHLFARARVVFERALQELHPQEKTEKLLINFARFEERSKEYERAKTIYTYALTQLQSRKQAAFGRNSVHLLEDDKDIVALKEEFVLFEKRHGKKEDIELALLRKKRDQYEELLAKDPYQYDLWFDYIRLEEEEGGSNNNNNSNNSNNSNGDHSEHIRHIYERAIVNVPLITDKKYWKRYVYLWIYYAVFEEVVMQDVARCREVYRRCLAAIPHRQFTFGKVWIYAAEVEIRAQQLTAARKLLGTAIGMCPGKKNLYQGYIEVELQLGEIDRCRQLYAKYIAAMPDHSQAWLQFAQLEVNVGELARARSIFELAIGQEVLDMPELLWKAYIDLEIAEQEVEHVRQLYERLLERSNHVKVWISYGKFEFEQGKLLVEGLEAAAAAAENGDEVVLTAMERARSVFARSYDTLKREGLKEERVLLLEAWRDVESAGLQQAMAGSGRAHLTEVEAKFPKKIKMKKTLTLDQGGTVDEEYYDYVFADDEKKLVGMKLLEKALAWKNAAANFANTAAAAADSTDSVPETSVEEEEEAASSSSSVLGKRNHDDAEIDI